MEAEIAEMPLQAKNTKGCWPPQGAGARLGSESPSELPEGTKLVDVWTSDFSPPELGETKFVILSRLACGHLSRPPQEIHTPRS